MEIKSVLLQTIPMAKTLLMVINMSHTAEPGFLQADSLITGRITLMGKMCLNCIKEVAAFYGMQIFSNAVCLQGKTLKSPRLTAEQGLPYTGEK